jgi:hypothetical protein
VGTETLQVLRKIHLKSFCALPYEVDYETSDLGGSILSHQLSCDQLEGEAHCVALDRRYLVASHVLLDISVGVFNLLRKSVIHGFSQIKISWVRALHT